mmetsp:Transcript_17485/g.39618  ORF Transcript_17485/g.39618 Transcript_17485/m.39618 type:complete len:436 (-) Transcript_17485:76-1383(-)
MATDHEVSIESDSDKVKVVFKMFDKDKNGKITIDELKRVLQSLDRTTWTDQAVNKLLESSDKNGDGELQFTEFWGWVCGHGDIDDESDALRQSLLDEAVDQEKHSLAENQAKREVWEAKKAKQKQKEADSIRREVERADGTRITRKQFIAESQSIGLTKQVAGELFSKFDEDNDGDIDQEERCWMGAGEAASVGQIKGLYKKGREGESANGAMQQIVDTFSKWDVNGDGTITCEELARVIHTLNPELTQRTVERMMQEADSSQDGVIDIVEFVHWLSGENPKKKKAKEEQEARMACAMHKIRSAEARQQGLQRPFEDMQHSALGKFLKKRKIKAVCETLNRGPGAPTICGRCDQRHGWLCHGCGFVSYYDQCINGCPFGEAGWSCISGSCTRKCGCKKKPEFWARRGFAQNFKALNSSVQTMLEARSTPASPGGR